MSSQVEELQRKILFQDREIRRLNEELNDRTLRENELISEITRLQDELDYFRKESKQQERLVQIKADTLEEFLDPSLPNTFATGEGTGLEEEWEDFMYAYTDELFIEDDEPDLLLFRDDREKCYRSETGNTRLYFPISKAELKILNILKIRPLTPEEEEALAQRLENE